MRILEPIKINNQIINNRIVYPPAVLFGFDCFSNHIGPERLEHYKRIADAGTGLIIIEATCVDPFGKLSPGQLGLWEDSQINGFKKLCSAIHEAGSKVFVQIHHGGANTHPLVNSNPIAPSYIEGRTCREATIDELKVTQQNFINTAKRAKDAGADGVELHAAHGYLLSQMASPVTNLRKDEYGGALQKRIKLAVDILKGIRNACGADFTIGVRMGGYEPEYEQGIEIAKNYEAAGADYLHVSWGILGKDKKVPEVPEGFIGNAIVHSAGLVKKNVKIPVIAVNSINTAQNGGWLIENGHADMVAYCRPILATPDFARRVMEDKKETTCIRCRNCFWFTDPAKCPGRKIWENSKES